MNSILSWLSNPIGSAIGAIGGVISNTQQAKENQKNRDWNEKMWQMNNEYNDPSAVRARLEAAGMNPNLAYGSIGQGLSSYSGNLGTDNNFENPLKGTHLGFIEAENLKNQTELKDSQVTTNATQQELNQANAKKAESEAKVQDKIAEYKTTENKYQESNIILDLAKKGLENSVLELTRDYTADANPLQLSILREQVEKAKYEKQISENTANKILAEIENIKEEKNLILEQEKTERSKQSANYASAEASKASAVASRASAFYTTQLGITERDLRPAQKEKLENEALNLLRDLRVKDSQIKMNETEAKMLIINGIIAYNKYELDKWIATVRDEFGSSTAQVVSNIVKQSLIGVGNNLFKWSNDRQKRAKQLDKIFKH